jgi:hypothetical protein
LESNYEVASKLARIEPPIRLNMAIERGETREKHRISIEARSKISDLLNLVRSRILENDDSKKLIAYIAGEYKLNEKDFVEDVINPKEEEVVVRIIE